MDHYLVSFNCIRLIIGSISCGKDEFDENRFSKNWNEDCKYDSRYTFILTEAKVLLHRIKVVPGICGFHERI